MLFLPLRLEISQDKLEIGRVRMAAEGRAEVASPSGRGQG
jgi:hypothetical protein